MDALATLFSSKARLNSAIALRKVTAQRYACATYESWQTTVANNMSTDAWKCILCRTRCIHEANGLLH